MKQLFTLLTILFLSVISGQSQSLYFPPTSGTQWDTLSPQSLQWCPEKIDTLLTFLDTTHTKAFIVLKDGKRVVEHYFDAFQPDSIWYWASAGKSLAAFLTGLAQEQGYLSIDDPVSDYLGQGWTSMPDSLERQITIRHQLTMTTGLDYGVPNPDCTDPACLQYKSDPGTQWYYHNAPYTLTHPVVEAAAGVGYNVFTFQQLALRTGIAGLWLPIGNNEVFASTPRVMARFGLLMLANGVWDNDTIMQDQQYLQNMVTPSNTMNEAYGYLWWLNGQSSYQLPGITFSLPGMLIPNAPADLYAGLGKNDQKVYVIPSENMVVVRMGNAAGQSLLASSSFDNQLWGYLSDMTCDPVGVASAPSSSTKLFPNPTKGHCTVQSHDAIHQLAVYNSQGSIVWLSKAMNTQVQLDTDAWPVGLYWVVVQFEDSRERLPLVVH